MGNLFGRSFSDVGSTSSDFLIKTRGQVKVQIGGKFIDLIKDGKINVTSKFIYQEKKVGIKDGIYVLPDGKITLVVNGQSIDLVGGETGNTYVSFIENQKSDSIAKHNALINIGFLYNSLSDLNENSLKNGIVYIESEQKFYIIKDGIASEFKLEIPNPYPKQFVISIADESNGALVIKGQGQNNSIAFDSLSIYQDQNESYIDSEKSVHIKINSTEQININNENTTFNNIVQSNNFQSIDASSDYGFRLYNSDKSCLEVDKLIVRNKIILPDKQTDFPETIKTKYWDTSENIINSVSVYDPQEDVEDAEEDSEEIIQDSSENLDENILRIGLIYKNTFNVNDCLYTYIYVNDYPESDTEEQNEESDETETETETSPRTELIAFKVNKVYDDDPYNIIVSLQKDFMPLEYQELTSLAFKSLINQKLYLVGSDNGVNLLKVEKQNIDILNSKSFEEEKDISKVTTRIGNLDELNVSGIENKKEVLVKGKGIYSENAIFEKAQYSSKYNLPKNDSSSKFASTEWVSQLIPKGAIIMYNGLSSEIPEGWHICDGTNGTPNLIGKFIKASDVNGKTGGNSNIQILEENMPKHTHTIINGIFTTSENGNHQHTYDLVCDYVGGQGSQYTITRNGPVDSSRKTSNSGAHTHTIDISNAQLSYSGGGKPINFEPEYYSLIYIMKIN